MEGALHLLLTACKQAEKEKKAETGELSEEKNSKREKNEMFAYTSLSLKSSFFRDLLEEESSLDKEKGN